MHNQNFDRVQFDMVKNEAGLNHFIMTPTKWLQQMNVNEYSCAVKLHDWCGGNRQSGIREISVASLFAQRFI